MSSLKKSFKFDAAEPNIIFFIPHMFLFVKMWCLHYPQSHSVSNGLVVDVSVLC